MKSIRVVLSQGTRCIDYGIFDVNSVGDFNTMRDHLYSIKGISRGRFWLTSLHYRDQPAHGEWSVIRIAVNLLRCESYQDWLETLEAEYEYDFNTVLRSTRARLLDRDIFNQISSASEALLSDPAVKWPFRKRGLLAVFVTRPFGRGDVRGEVVIMQDQIESDLEVRPPLSLTWNEFINFRFSDGR